MDCVRIHLLIGLLLVAAAGVSTSAASRVKQLVKHFELIEKSSQDINVAQSTSVILSLSESATKLYKLTHGLAQDVRCNRYVKLISMPDIRSVATISALAKETGALNEHVQTDANLIARLTSEREFDSMGRIQAIIQTLDSERTLGKSNFEPNIEKELLSCVNYYVYRHQNALVSVIEHVHTSMDNLPKHLNKPTDSELLVEKIRELIEEIVDIEQGGNQEHEFNYEDWLESLGKLQTLAIQNDFEIPQLARDFLVDSRRVDRLNLCLESDELKDEILEAEPILSRFNKRSIANQAYRTALHKLYVLCSSPDLRSRPPVEYCKILLEPRRSKIVKELNKERMKSDESTIELDQPTGYLEPATTSNGEPGDRDSQQTTESKKAEQHSPSESDLPRGLSCIETLFEGAWSFSGDKQRELELCASEESRKSKIESDPPNQSEPTKPRKRWFW